MCRCLEWNWPPQTQQSERLVQPVCESSSLDTQLAAQASSAAAPVALRYNKYKIGCMLHAMAMATHAHHCRFVVNNIPVSTRQNNRPSRRMYNINNFDLVSVKSTFYDLWMTRRWVWKQTLRNQRGHKSWF